MTPSTRGVTRRLPGVDNSQGYCLVQRACQAFFIELSNRGWRHWKLLGATVKDS